MRELKAIAEELIRRQRMDVRYSEGGLTIPIDGEDIFVCEDSEHGRVLLWAEVAQRLQTDAPRAAEISIAYNENFSFERAVTLGVSPEADSAILGRGMDAENLDSVRILREARSFRAELEGARAFFRDELAKRAPSGTAQSPMFAEFDEARLKA